MNKVFTCPRCNNSDTRYIGYINNKPYCRFCISFAGIKARPHKVSNSNIKLSIDYHLSKNQEKVANKVLESFKKGENCLIYAVTGAGKTELVYYTIEYALQNNMLVGFAIPRKDVVIELYSRIKNAFPKAKTIYVVGEHSNDLYGDICLLTTHQIYRYEKYFDLLIVDEIDAFPYKNNIALKTFMLNSYKRSHILLSATPSEEDINHYRKYGKIYTMFERYHHYDLPVPIFIKANLSPIMSLIKYMSSILKKKLPLFVFCPTIEIANKVFSVIKFLFPNGKNVNSQTYDRSLIIEEFKKRKYDYLITTSILERGVTLKDLQVIVYLADHELYDKASLIQIAGRVGRKKESPYGKVLFIGKEKNEEIISAIEEIDRINTNKTM